MRHLCQRRLTVKSTHEVHGVCADSAIDTHCCVRIISHSARKCRQGAIQVNGTVRHFTLEGGFWAVRGDDGVTYDPMNGLAPEFERENLRVIMVAKVRDDVGGIHMVGPIVEVLSIGAADPRPIRCSYSSGVSMSANAPSSSTVISSISAACARTTAFAPWDRSAQSSSPKSSRPKITG